MLQRFSIGPVHLLFASAILALFLAGCNGQTGTGPEELSPAAEATIASLMEENQRLASEVDRLRSETTSSEQNSDLLGEMIAQQDSPGTTATEPTPSSPLQEPAATPVPTATPLPSPTPLPTFVPEPMDGDPPDGAYVAAGPFSSAWQADPERQQTLGWAIEPAGNSVTVVTQPFEHGLMLWRSDTEQIFALWEAEGQQNWRAFVDTFQEGEPETDPALNAPGGLLQPERGFGKLWRQNPELQSALGWALAREYKSEAQLQAFQRGLMAYAEARIYGIGQTPAGEPVWFVE